MQPYWLERQTDPGSPAFVPLGDPPAAANLTARDWTTIGTSGVPACSVVDPRGLVTPWVGGWSLDWWVGAEDRWYLPSREAAVRQHLVDDAPVVETAMRVPGGDVVHRAYGVQAGGAGGAGLVVVEVENATPVPVALAFAVRPYNAEGPAPIRHIGCSGETVSVDGRLALRFARPPARVALSTSPAGDCAGVVLSGRAGPGGSSSAADPAGGVTGAFVVPLPHTAIARVVLPLVRPGPVRRRPRIWPGRAVPPAVPSGLPVAAAVARGWRAHAARGMRLVLPDDRLASCVEAQRRFLLLLHDADRAAPGFGVPDAVAMVGALGRYGYDAEAADVLRRYPAGQRSDGSFPDPHGDADANGRALVALREHLRLHPDPSLLAAAVPTVVKGAEWIERRRHRRRAGATGRRGRPTSTGGAEHVERLWGARGLLDAGELLGAAGEGGAADVARRYGEAFRAEIESSLRPAEPAAATGGAGWPEVGAPGDVAGSLAACWPLRLFPSDHPGTVAMADLVRERFMFGAAVLAGDGARGLGPAETLQLAFVEMEAHDPRALERLWWLLDVASPARTWAEAVHPRLAGGSSGNGHSVRVGADLLSFVRNLLVRETTDGLDLCTLVPESWRGAGIEVHEAPTHAGRLSFAVRWHGDRPALLWDLELRPGGFPVHLRAPGLDPSWSTSEPAGEALLARVPPPAGQAAPSGGSFS